MPNELEASRACHARNQRRYHDNGRRVLNLVKWMAGCADCGYDENPNGMEFDHVVEKRGYPGRHTNRGPVTTNWRLWRDVMDTEVVCGTCHNIRTAERGGYAN